MLSRAVASAAAEPAISVEDTEGSYDAAGGFAVESGTTAGGNQKDCCRRLTGLPGRMSFGVFRGRDVFMPDGQSEAASALVDRSWSIRFGIVSNRPVPH